MFSFSAKNLLPDLEDRIPFLRGVSHAGPRYPACHRLFDFTKCLRLTPGCAYCASGKVNSVNTLYLDRTRKRTPSARSQEKRHLHFTDRNSRNGVSSKLTALYCAELRQGRSDRGSSPCSMRPRSLSQTSLSSRHMHRLPRVPGAGS